MASGDNSPLSYQWQLNGTNLAHATNSSLALSSIRMSDAGVYSVIVSNAVGTVVSAPATIVVISQHPTIVSQPLGRAVAPGVSVVLSVGASGALPLSYQWQKSGQSIAAQTNATLALPSATIQDSGVYAVIVSNPFGSVTSSNAVVLVTLASYDFPYTFTTLAGQRFADGGFDGRFNFPQDLAVDGAGTVYVADPGQQTIRKLTPENVVSTLAGLARTAGSVDGAGSNARFDGPTGVAVDRAGTIYVAEAGNLTIRKITPDGVVTTLAGLAKQHGSVDGTGSNARFSDPRRVAADSRGNVYVADQGSHTIRRITPDGTVSTLAGLADNPGSVDGTGSNARFNTPLGVAADSGGNVYVADQGNHTIRRISPDGIVKTLTGRAGQSGSNDGVGESARFSFPNGVAVDGEGTVYVADYANHMIRKITPEGVVTTLAGLPGSSNAVDGVGNVVRFCCPEDVAVDSAGNLYVVEPLGNYIRKGVPSRPVLSSLIQIPDQTAFLGLVLTLTNQVTDTNINKSVLAFSLDPGSPQGASIDPFTGVMNWAPDPKNSTRTNTITVRATFYGSSNLTTTNSFRVIVGDSVELQLGATDLPTGRDGTVAVDAKFHTLSDHGVTNLSFILAYPANLMTNLNIALVSSNASSTSISPVDTSHVLITIQAKAGEMFSETQRLAQITFTGSQITVSDAGILSVDNVQARENDGSLIQGIVTRPGRVIVANRIPYFEARLSSPAGRQLVLFGETGTKYQIESRTNLFGADVWIPANLITLPDYFQILTNVEQGSRTIFYRARIMP